MYVDRPDWIVVGDCVCCGETLTVDCRDFNNVDIPDVCICDHCCAMPSHAPIVAELKRRVARGLVRAQPVVEPAPAQDEREMGELRVRVENGRRQFEFEEYDAAYSLPAGTHYLYTRPTHAEQQPIRMPERKRTEHLPKEYKTMTVVRAGLEAYNRALDDVAALNAAPIAQTDLVGALRLCVASLDQLLPHLAKVPADIGLLNSALIAGRSALASVGGDK